MKINYEEIDTTGITTRIFVDTRNGTGVIITESPIMEHEYLVVSYTNSKIARSTRILTKTEILNSYAIKL